MNNFSEIEFSELTKLVVSRIQKLEPENAIKILGCLFLNSPSEQRMFQLAFWSEDEIQPIISNAKATLNMMSTNHAELAQPCWEPPFTSDQQHPIHNLNLLPRPYVDDCNQPHFLNLEERLDNLNVYGPNLSNHCYFHDDTLGGNLNMRVNGRSPSLPEYAIKACHYFYKGYCKHGADCRYFHGHCIPEGDSQIYNANLDEMENEDHRFSPGSLEKLEKEITELLKAKGRMPISISSLPEMYFEQYGRNLQAEGYLTESQRHGKPGLTLTKLLARLKNSIRLIDKPHGQHSVILAEDAPRYIEYMNQMSSSGAITSSSHQIYLTFPADSTFTAEDVSNYFKQFGPVRDVRIPCQEKRMFGFVSFLYPETARIILTKRNPHFICGARVLVKPYKEKSRTPDRAHNEKFQPVVHYPPFIAMDSELYAAQRRFNNSRLIRKQEIEQQERMIELERRRLSEFGLSLRPPVQPCYNYSMEDYKVPEGPNELPSTDHFSYTLDALNNGSMNDEKAKNTDNGYDNHESQFDLPESPFASPPVENGIAALI